LLNSINNFIGKTRLHMSTCEWNMKKKDTRKDVKISRDSWDTLTKLARYLGQSRKKVTEQALELKLETEVEKASDRTRGLDHVIEEAIPRGYTHAVEESKGLPSGVFAIKNEQRRVVFGRFTAIRLSDKTIFGFEPLSKDQCEKLGIVVEESYSNLIERREVYIEG